MGSTVKELMGLAPELRRQFDGTNAFTVRAFKGTVGFGDAGVAVEIGQIPADAIPIGVIVNVTTAFNSSGTDLIDVGTGTDPDGYSVDEDGATAGTTFSGDGALIGDAATADTVEVLYTQSVADATAGSAQVTVLYLEA